MTRTTTALVAPTLDGSFTLEQVNLESLQSDEALVEIHAVGVCHTDLSCASGKLPCAPNAVLGHEGAGVVLETGSAVTTVSKGDKVLLSFAHCGSCSGCESGHPAYCYGFKDYNFAGKRQDGSTALFITKDGQKQPIHSTFFGQSSFARHAIVHRSSLVKVPQETPLDLFAPLGCGIQTGVGAVLNTLNVKPGSSLAVFGVGSVGLAAVMAAKARQVGTIIAIDLHPERIELAKQLGATHGVLGPDQDGIINGIKDICPPIGVDFAVDCTGVPSIIETMVESLGMKGRAATVGAPGGNAQARIGIMSHLTYGREYVGCSMGDGNPLIPELIRMHSQGLLPLEKLIAYYDINDHERAIMDTKSGKTMVNLPSPFNNIPRVKLLFNRPADIEPLSRLTKDLNCNTQLWIAREDGNSGLAFAGNKVRKLEYVLADALAQGADTLVTTGGIQSNHMCQTSAAAARLGLEVALYPMDAVASNDAEYKYSGNVQVNDILGAETFPLGTSEDVVVDTLKKRGRKLYSIPPGASTHPQGGLGYARWVFELLEQEARLGISFGVIALAAGSCSTLGGMVAGLKLAQKYGLQGSKKRLIGFSILRPSKEEARELVLTIAKNTASRIGITPGEITEDDFEIDISYLGGSYGQLDERTAEGMKELARMEGILTDPVYTGKAFTGLLHTARKGEFKNKNVLFVHTGGQAALGAYPGLR
ncbi:hypothetical protein F66182_2506 [Fusarium sp. NRRL 66182]|nr:hypothetical protein F66182_2506 [Fusarium sp. NRRL 66182]